MKKLLLYSLFVMLSLCMTAQGTYTLTFNCVEQFGETVQPEVITVTNVTRNWTETLNYPENTLVLYWNGVDENYGSGGYLSEAYPNPFNGSTNVSFSGSNGLMKARVINLNGDVLAEYNTVTNGGNYMITIDLAQPQMALLVVNTETRQFVKKIINTSFGQCNNITINETAATQQQPTRDLRVPGDFCPGDMMSYRASFMDGVNCIVSETVEKQQFDSETIIIPFTFTAPTVLTLDIYDVHRWTAKGTGSVISCGGQITCGDRGFCWDTEPHPTIELGSTHYSWCGQGPGEFTDCDLDFLVEGTLHYGRAYARNKYGVGYGEEIAFVTTQPGNGFPVVTTGDVTNITGTSAWCNNNHVTSTTELIEYGICWMKENIPNINGPHVAVGSGGLEATFNGYATGLEMTSTYYVCAYATNSAGTRYGSQKMFTTTDNTPYGGLPGRFTISEDGDKVCFSKGNLQYKASTNEWKFAEHQYDIIGEGNENISSTYNGWIDLFGWGTSGNNHGAVCYQPWSTQYVDQFYWAYGEWTSALNDRDRSAMWVYNVPITNAATASWQTLDKSDWQYLLFERTTASGLRFAKGQVGDVNGLIIYPDDWDVTFHYPVNANNPNSDYLTGISAAAWDAYYEPRGAVFIPCAGRRTQTTFYPQANTRGYYWTCRNSSYIQGGDKQAYCLFFSDFTINPAFLQNRAQGFSVRPAYVFWAK